MPKLAPTKQTLALVAALNLRGLKTEVEHWDGHKHVDICVPEAKLYIEVDGLQHYTNPKQILADFQRDHFSDNDQFHTLRLTNQLIETHLDEVASAIAQIASQKAG